MADAPEGVGWVSDADGGWDGLGILGLVWELVRMVNISWAVASVLSERERKRKRGKAAGDEPWNETGLEIVGHYYGRPDLDGAAKPRGTTRYGHSKRDQIMQSLTNCVGCSCSHWPHTFHNQRKTGNVGIGACKIRITIPRVDINT